MSFPDIWAEMLEAALKVEAREEAARPHVWRAGVSDAPRIPCARSPENHGFHPDDEACPYC